MKKIVLLVLLVAATLCLAACEADPAKGFVYTVDAGEVTIAQYTGNAKEVNIPDAIEGMPVTTIGDGAFQANARLTSVTIPDSVTSIGERAFQDCKSMTSVTLGSGLEVIAKDAFRSCEALQRVAIPDSVTDIGESAFSRCIKLIQVTLGSAVESVGASAFDGCYALTGVSFPDSVKRIGQQAFSQCHELTSVAFPDSVREIGSSAFSFCGKLETVSLGNSLKKIESHTFRWCDALQSVTIPDNVTHIGEQAFACCKSLETVTLGSGLKKIADEAFASCVALQKVTIPDNVTEIGKSAFAKCAELTSVAIGHGISEIPASTFEACRKLSEITYFDTTYTSMKAFLQGEDPLSWSVEALAARVSVQEKYDGLPMYTPKAPVEGVALFVHDLGMTFENAPGRSRYMRGSIGVQMNGKLRFTDDPDQASILIFYEEFHQAAGQYSGVGVIRGYSSILRLRAIPLTDEGALWVQVSENASPGKSIDVVLGATKYYAPMPALLGTVKMDNFIKKVRAFLPE